MAPRLTVKYNQPLWLLKLRNGEQAVATAALAALREIAADAVQEGRQNIGSAGPGFTHGKWQSGLQYLTKGATEGGAPSLNAKAVIFHKYGIAGVFEHGATLQGKPMLWIPTTHGAPTASRSGKKLVSATVRGQPMLFDANDKSRDRKPLYIGVKSVRIPKKFRIFEIVKKHVAQFKSVFARHFKGTE